MKKIIYKIIDWFTGPVGTAEDWVNKIWEGQNKIKENE